MADYQQFDAAPNEPVWPQGRAMRGGRVCVQSGVKIGAEALYEPWTCLPTSEAVEYGTWLREQNPGGNGER